MLCWLNPLPAWANPSLTVIADNGLNLILPQVARAFTAEHSLSLTFSFATPEEQEEQIADGAAADVLITTRDAFIDTLRGQGLIDIYSQTSFARGLLVFAGATGSPDFNLEEDLATQLIKNGEPIIAIGNPQTTAEGAAARAALRRLDAAQDLEAFTIYPRSSRALLESLEKEKNYGLVLNHMVMGLKNIRNYGKIPENSYPPIRYIAVVLAGENMGNARNFLQYLGQPEAQKIFQANGLGAP